MASPKVRKINISCYTELLTFTNYNLFLLFVTVFKTLIKAVKQKFLDVICNIFLVLGVPQIFFVQSVPSTEMIENHWYETYEDFTKTLN